MGLNKSKGNMYPWMAGFMDGEAWVGMSKQIRKERPSPTYRCVVTLPNQQIESLRVFEKEYGGRIRREKNCYRWYCPSKSLRKLLKDVIPFLVLKGEQARLMLRFVSTVKKKYGNKALSKRDITERESFYIMMKVLNRHTFWEEKDATK